MERIISKVTEYFSNKTRAGLTLLAFWSAISLLQTILNKSLADLMGIENGTLNSFFCGLQIPTRILFIPIPDFLLAIPALFSGNNSWDIYFERIHDLCLADAATGALLIASIATLLPAKIQFDTKKLAARLGVIHVALMVVKLPEMILYRSDLISTIKFYIPSLVLPVAGTVLLVLDSYPETLERFKSKKPQANLSSLSFMSQPNTQPPQPEQATTMTNNETSNSGAAWNNTNTFGFSTDMTTPVYRVQVMGTGDRLFSIAELGEMARVGVLQPNTLAQHKDVPYPVQASTIPGVFSSRSWIGAMLISFFLGALGIDRFYLGYNGLGVAKLLTGGGCGVWALIDFILIAMRKIPDAEGKPLS